MEIRRSRKVVVGGAAAFCLAALTTALVASEAADPAEPIQPAGRSTLAPPSGNMAVSERPSGAGQWTAGSSLGFLGSTPDGTALALNGHGDYFVTDQFSIGPLAQLGLTDDMTLLGLSGQGKFWLDMPGTQGKGKMVLQSGVGFAHADVNRSDTSWLVPLGIGYDYALDPGIDLTATALVNFTDLNTGGGADVMPGFAFGVRF